jgi:hypothetical protein
MSLEPLAKTKNIKMSKIKIHIPRINVGGCNKLYTQMLLEEFDLVDNPEQADYVLAWKGFPWSTNYLNQFDLSKVLFFQDEPLITKHRIWLAERYDKFHSVFCLNPDPNKKNQFPITNNPLGFPYQSYYLGKIRGDTTISKKRHLFYAGWNKPEQFRYIRPDLNVINLVDVREKIITEIHKTYPNSTILGPNWVFAEKTAETNTPAPEKCIQKSKDIEKCNADFVLCLENSMFENYIADKIHDGLRSDRVMLYLGAPNIEDYVPVNCFIDLRPYFNKETGEFDVQGMLNKIKTITQEEYDKIIENSRKFRETKQNGQIQKKALTDFVIRRIKTNELRKI